MQPYFLHPKGPINNIIQNQSIGHFLDNSNSSQCGNLKSYTYYPINQFAVHSANKSSLTRFLPNKQNLSLHQNQKIRHIRGNSLQVQNASKMETNSLIDQKQQMSVRDSLYNSSLSSKADPIAMQIQTKQNAEPLMDEIKQADQPMTSKQLPNQYNDQIITTNNVQNINKIPAIFKVEQQQSFSQRMQPQHQDSKMMQFYEQKIKQLESEIECLSRINQQKETCQDQVRSMEDKVSNVIQANADLAQQLLAKSSQVSSLQADQVQTQKELNALRLEAGKAREQIDQQAHLLKVCQNEQQNWVNQHEAIIMKNQMNEEAVKSECMRFAEDKERALQASQLYLQQCENQKRDVFNANLLYQQQIAEMNSKIRQLEMQLDNSSVHWQSEFQTKKLQMSQELESVQHELFQLQQMHQSDLKSLNALQVSLTETTAKLELAVKQSEGKEQLQKELSAMVDSRFAANGRLDLLVKEKQALQEQVDALQCQCQKGKDQLTELQQSQSIEWGKKIFLLQCENERLHAILQRTVHVNDENRKLRTQIDDLEKVMSVREAYIQNKELENQNQRKDFEASKLAKENECIALQERINLQDMDLTRLNEKINQDGTLLRQVDAELASQEQNEAIIKGLQFQLQTMMQERGRYVVDGRMTPVVHRASSLHRNKSFSDQKMYQNYNLHQRPTLFNTSQKEKVFIQQLNY